MLREANCEHCAGYRRYVVAEIGGIWNDRNKDRRVSLIGAWDNLLILDPVECLNNLRGFVGNFNKENIIVRTFERTLILNRLLNLY